MTWGGVCSAGKSREGGRNERRRRSCSLRRKGLKDSLQHSRGRRASDHLIKKKKNDRGKHDEEERTRLHFGSKKHLTRGTIT